ncbi:MAG: RNA polymerase sigma factor [Balneolaceae bacterium]|nr:RNA polymerase sigma factor [Balneolaceae bacterium]
MADIIPSEKELIGKIVSGERHRYKVLVERYSPMVFHIIRRFVDDEDDVEELAQQVFVKTFEKLESFDTRSKFSTWLFMIAKNHCRDYVKNIRRQNKRFSEMDSYELEQQMPKSESTDHDIQADEWSFLIKEALNHINEDYAKVFLMKYRDGMTYKVMSERLDASVSALKVRVHRARKALKHFIEQNS